MTLKRTRVQGDLYHGVIPDGAVYIGRAAPGLPASPWANPFKPKKPTPVTVRLGGRTWTVGERLAGQWPPDRAATVDWYRLLIDHTELRDAIIADLAGKNVACWCKTTDACHGDVLLRIAAGGEP